MIVIREVNIMSGGTGALHTLLRTPVPATGIEHSIQCHFLDPQELSLVTAGANILRVFRIRPQAGQDEGRSPIMHFPPEP